MWLKAIVLFFLNIVCNESIGYGESIVRKEGASWNSSGLKQLVKLAIKNPLYPNLKCGSVSGFQIF